MMNPGSASAAPRLLSPARLRINATAIWLAAAAGLSAGLAALIVAVEGDAVPRVDLAIARAVQSVDFFLWDYAIGFGELLTGAPEGLFVWALLVLGFWLAGRPVEAIVMGLTAAIWVPKAIVEELVSRARPTEGLLDVAAAVEGSSFPSGHITAGVAVFGMLAVIAVVRLPTWRSRALLIGPVVAILSLSALSRLTDGAHWPSDVLAGLLLGALWLIGMTWVYLSLRRDRLPLPGLRLAKRLLPSRPVRAPDGVRLAGSIASTVYLDDAAGTAVKVYRPSLPVRLLYWAAFQAPFPYSAREEALRTAAAAREFTGLLTQYWTGADMVAAARDVRVERGEFHFVTDLVQGQEPADNAAIIDVLRGLRRNFAAAGLPTWQIDPENPHAHTNFIRTPDGALKIIDLESTLIPLIQPLGQLPRLLRMGRFPTFDDVDFDRLNAYLRQEEHSLREVLGPADFARLQRAVAGGERWSAAWKSREPNLPGRVGHRLWHWLDWDRRARPIRSRLLRAEEFALAFLAEPLDRWVADGRIAPQRAEELRARLHSDAMRGAVRHLGIAVAISVPLRFPFGSLARFGLVIYFRYRATRLYWSGEIDADAYRQARDTHTGLVALVALIPGLGAGAYLLSPAMRRSGNLIPLAVDQSLYRLPFGLYARLHLRRLTAWRRGVSDTAPAGAPAPVSTAAYLAPAQAHESAPPARTSAAAPSARAPGVSDHAPVPDRERAPTADCCRAA